MRFVVVFIVLCILLLAESARLVNKVVDLQVELSWYEVGLPVLEESVPDAVNEFERRADSLVQDFQWIRRARLDGRGEGQKQAYHPQKVMIKIVIIASNTLVNGYGGGLTHDE